MFRYWINFIRPYVLVIRQSKEKGNGQIAKNFFLILAQNLSVGPKIMVSSSGIASHCMPVMKEVLVANAVPY